MSAYMLNHPQTLHKSTIYTLHNCTSREKVNFLKKKMSKIKIASFNSKHILNYNNKCNSLNATPSHENMHLISYMHIAYVCICMHHIIFLQTKTFKVPRVIVFTSFNNICRNNWFTVGSIHFSFLEFKIISSSISCIFLPLHHRIHEKFIEYVWQNIENKKLYLSVCL